MSDTIIHVVGHVGTEVDRREVAGGTPFCTFRLATTPRYYDRGQRGYVDGTTNWLSVECWRSLALHVVQSVGKGDPVIVIGKLRTQEWEKDGQRSSRLLVEAVAVGHDLSRGVSRFTKSVRYGDPGADRSAVASGTTEARRAVSAIALQRSHPAGGGGAQMADAS